VLIKWIGGDYDTVWSSPVIDNLADVTVTTPADGQVLTYDSVTSQWVNETPAAGGGSSNLDGLTDVTISSPQGSQILKYNSSTSQWVNGYAEATNQVGIFVGNATASTIPSLSVVYISGDVGFSTLVELASNDSANGEKAIGVTNGSINSGAGGQVITKGYIYNVNTSAWSSGDILWLGTNGQITNVKPTNPTSLVKVGYVTIDSATTGQIYVDVEVEQKTVSVDGLSDATITSPADGQVLTYDSATSQWVNEYQTATYPEIAPKPTANAIEVPSRSSLTSASGTTTNAGLVIGSTFVAPDNRTISSVYFYATGWNSNTCTLFKMGLYKKTGATEWTLLQSSVSDTSKPTGLVEKTLGASVTLEAGATYAICFIGVGSGPTLLRAGAIADSVNGHGTPLSFALASQTDLPATITSPELYANLFGMGAK
jgi:hypothetical protein